MAIFNCYVSSPEGIIVWGSPLSNWALAWRSFLASASRNPLVNLSRHFTFTLLGCSVVVKTCQTKTLWCDYILLTHPHKWCCQRPSAPLGCRFGQQFSPHGRHNFAKIHCSTNPFSVGNQRMVLRSPIFLHMVFRIKIIIDQSSQYLVGGYLVSTPLKNDGVRELGRMTSHIWHGKSFKIPWFQSTSNAATRL